MTYFNTVCHFYNFTADSSERQTEQEMQETCAVSYRCAIVTPNKVWQPGD